MAKKYTYDEIFQRNIGVFTKEEQKKIRNLKIAIAGVGGMGGSVAYSLARLGVGEFRLADPEKFEISNVNRQFGAYTDTVGMYKSDAIEQELKRINPEIIIKKWNEPLTPKNIEDFLKGTDVVFDGMEFFELENERYLHKVSVKNKLWVFILQGVFNITTFLAFNPDGVTFEEMFVVDEKVDLGTMISKMFPELPKGASPEAIQKIMQDYNEGKEIHFPSYSVLAPMGGTFLVEEFIKVIVRGEKPAEEAPNIFSLNLETMEIKHYKSK